MQILGEEKPTTSYVIDDANAINKTTEKALNDRLKRLEIETGYRITAVTVRKLEVEADAFAFTDRVIEGWCVSYSPSAVLCWIHCGFAILGTRVMMLTVKVLLSRLQHRFCDL